MVKVRPRVPAALSTPGATIRRLRLRYAPVAQHAGLALLLASVTARSPLAGYRAVSPVQPPCAAALRRERCAGWAWNGRLPSPRRGRTIRRSPPPAGLRG